MFPKKGSDRVSHSSVWHRNVSHGVDDWVLQVFLHLQCCSFDTFKWSVEGSNMGFKNTS